MKRFIWWFSVAVFLYGHIRDSTSTEIQFFSTGYEQSLGRALNKSSSHLYGNGKFFLKHVSQIESNIAQQYLHNVKEVQEDSFCVYVLQPVTNSPTPQVAASTVNIGCAERLFENQVLVLLVWTRDGSNWFLKGKCSAQHVRYTRFFLVQKMVPILYSISYGNVYIHVQSESSEFRNIKLAS